MKEPKNPFSSYQTTKPPRGLLKLLDEGAANTHALAKLLDEHGNAVEGPSLEDVRGTYYRTDENKVHADWGTSF